MSMNLPFLPLQLPQINKGKQVMALKTPFLSFFFSCPMRPLWRLLRVAQTQQSKNLLQFLTGLLDLLIPSKDHIFIIFWMPQLRNRALHKPFCPVLQRVWNPQGGNGPWYLSTGDSSVNI